MLWSIIVNKKLTIGKVVLGKIPHIVAVVEKPLTLKRLDDIKKQGASILEIRVDLFPGPFSKTLDYIKKTKGSTGFGLIGTIRETVANKANRLDMFKEIMPFVDAVDIESDAVIAARVVALAQKKCIIVSEHDFKKTPDFLQLTHIADRAQRLGANIVKIAAMARSYDDVIRLMEFVHGRKGNCVVFAMGEYGALSRVVSPMYGTLFTYGFVDTAVAPGQLSVKELGSLLPRFFPAMS